MRLELTRVGLLAELANHYISIVLWFDFQLIHGNLSDDHFNTKGGNPLITL